MEDVTQILDAVSGGDLKAAEQLLPLVYAELRRIAAHKMAAERPDHTLQPTALVHEAYLRLAGPDGELRDWETRGHFFAAAGEAMRRILIESARRKATRKRGANAVATTWDEGKFPAAGTSDELLAIHEILDQLEEQNAEHARIVKLIYFAGLSIAETAAAMRVSESTVDRRWRAARAWLYREISRAGLGPDEGESACHENS